MNPEDDLKTKLEMERKARSGEAEKRGKKNGEGRRWREVRT